MPSSDRKSTRLNSSHGSISYAVFCLKKKKKKTKTYLRHTDDTADTASDPTLYHDDYACAVPCALPGDRRDSKEDLEWVAVERPPVADSRRLAAIKETIARRV